MNTLFQQFNKYSQSDPNLIAKALSTASGVGAGFSPQSLEKIVTDTMIKLQPELALVQPVGIASKQHEFNRKTALPAPGGAMGESAVTPSTNSSNALATVALKVIRRKGQVTNFLKDVSREVLDVATYEMQNQLQAHALDLRNYLLYGNALANTYEFSGLDRFITTNRVNNSRGGVVPTSLKTIDDMIDATMRRGANGHRMVLGMSPEMLSCLSRLETTVRKTMDMKGAFDVREVAGGWRLTTYRDFPIIQTTATRPVETFRPTATLAGALVAANASGVMSDGTYYVNIAPITYEGEQLASAEQSITLSGGTATQSIRISLDTYHKDANGNGNVYAYRIYVGTATGVTYLRKIVPAWTYDAAGTPTLNNMVSTNYVYINSATVADASVNSAMALDVPYVATGGIAPETIYLWDLDPIQGLGKVPYTNVGGSAFNGLVTTEELAKIDDYLHFLIKSYCAMADSYEATSAWVRGLRIA